MIIQQLKIAVRTNISMEYRNRFMIGMLGLEDQGIGNSIGQA